MKYYSMKQVKKNSIEILFRCNQIRQLLFNFGHFDKLAKIDVGHWKKNNKVLPDE